MFLSKTWLPYASPLCFGLMHKETQIQLFPLWEGIQIPPRRVPKPLGNRLFWAPLLGMMEGGIKSLAQAASPGRSLSLQPGNEGILLEGGSLGPVLRTAHVFHMKQSLEKTSPCFGFEVWHGLLVTG